MKKIKSKLVALGIVIALISIFIFSSKSTFAAINPEDTSKSLFEQLNEEVENASDGTVIELPAGDYIFTKSIKIDGKKITLKIRVRLILKEIQTIKAICLQYLALAS